MHTIKCYSAAACHLAVAGYYFTLGFALHMLARLLYAIARAI